MKSLSAHTLQFSLGKISRDASRNYYLAGIMKQQALQWAEMRRTISTGALGCGDCLLLWTCRENLTLPGGFNMNMDLYNLLNHVSGKMSQRCSSCHKALCTAVWKKLYSGKIGIIHRHRKSVMLQCFLCRMRFLIIETLHSEWCRIDVI